MSRMKKITTLLLTVGCLSGFFYYWHGYYRSAFPADLTDQAIDSLFSLEDLVLSGSESGVIPSIDSPVFESVLNADQYLDDQGRGLVVLNHGSARFYPYQILVWHEIVNDFFGDHYLAVSYDPLCSSGLVFDRAMNSETYTFETSGFLWNSNLVFQDQETESLWVQILQRSVDGSLAGQELEVYPSSEMTWDGFKGAYPYGTVLSRTTGYDRDYTRDPYNEYQEDHSILYSLTHMDERMNSKERVLGVVSADGAKAYELSLFENESELYDAVGSADLTIEADSDQLYVNSTDEVVAYKTFWFCWAAAHPETELYNP